MYIWDMDLNKKIDCMIKIPLHLIWVKKKFHFIAWK